MTDAADSNPRPKSERPSINAHVLLVEDNPVNQQVAVGMLRHLGCTVDTANDGNEGVAAFDKGGYDLVLMDCQMPRLDGLAATQQIRARERERSLRPIPIIAVTASVLLGSRERCIEAGMNDYLAKPFTLVQLSEILRANLPD